MFCTKCGCQLPEDSKFCDQCRAAQHDLTDAPAPTTLVAETPAAELAPTPNVDWKEIGAQAKTLAQSGAAFVAEKAKGLAQSGSAFAAEKSKVIAEKVEARRSGAAPASANKELKALLLAVLPLGLIVISLITLLVFGFKDCGSVSYNYMSYSAGSFLNPDRYEANAWGRALNPSGAAADAKVVNKLCRERRFQQGGVGVLLSLCTRLVGAGWFVLAAMADDKKKRGQYSSALPHPNLTSPASATAQHAKPPALPTQEQITPNSQITASPSVPEKQEQGTSRNVSINRKRLTIFLS